MDLNSLSTPALLIDRRVLEQNCAAMASRARQLGVRLRPHLKTAKCAAVAKIAVGGQFGGITVSTVAEAAYFAAHGFTDLLLAVGISASKIPALAALSRAYPDLCITLITDSTEAVQTASDQADAAAVSFPVLVELDTGGGRGGVDPRGAALLQVARLIESSSALRLTGVVTHAGQSYHAKAAAALRAIAIQERDGAVVAAERLRSDNLPCPTVSIGSTPTAVHHPVSLSGITEIRPGVYTFMDLGQWALGVCAMEDIALSVVATVIGHNERSARILIDAGALALSKDLSAAEFRAQIGYGLVVPCPGHNLPIGELFVAEVHQEHGLIASAEGRLPWDALPIGGKVCVLPNHACLAAAPFDCYYVHDGAGVLTETWDKVRGW